MSKIFEFKKLIQSFRHAFNGLRLAFLEQTFKILVLFALLVVFLMMFLGVSLIEKTILILTIAMVLGLETINSQIERTLDILEPNYSSAVKNIKDISAAAVLIACFGAVIIGLIIFLPYLIT